MWTSAAVVVLGLQLVAAQHYHRYIRFPVGPGHEEECYDPQIDKYFNVGDVWGPKNANCKQSSCVLEKNTLYIDRMQCDRILNNVDRKKIKENNYVCRQAIGDRRKAFPACCPQLVCYEYVAGKKVRLPKDKYPWLKPVIRDIYVFV